MLLADLDPSLQGYARPTPNSSTGHLDERLRWHPEVRGVGRIDSPPLGVSNSDRRWQHRLHAGEGRRDVDWTMRAWARIFAVMGIPLTGGREFAKQDDSSAVRALVVNRRVRGALLARSGRCRQNRHGRSRLYRGGRGPHGQVPAARRGPDGVHVVPAAAGLAVRDDAHHPHRRRPGDDHPGPARRGGGPRPESSPGNVRTIGRASGLLAPAGAAHRGGAGGLRVARARARRGRDVRRHGLFGLATDK